MKTFETELHRSGQVTRVSVRPGERGGWELVVEEDSRVVRSTRYTDWHRVERAIASLALDEGVMAESAAWGEADPGSGGYSTKR